MIKIILTLLISLHANASGSVEKGPSSSSALSLVSLAYSKYAAAPFSAHLRNLNLFEQSLFLHALAFSTSPSHFSPGKYQLTDAFCTNPNYVQLPEEKAFVDAINSGYTLDQYLFTSSTHGQYLTRYNEQNASCIGISEIELEYLSESKVRIHFGGTKWTSETTQPNTSITCSGDEEPSEVIYTYELIHQDLYFIFPADSDCGEFRMKWSVLP